MLNHMDIVSVSGFSWLILHESQLKRYTLSCHRLIQHSFFYNSLDGCWDHEDGKRMQLHSCFSSTVFPFISALYHNCIGSCSSICSSVTNYENSITDYLQLHSSISEQNEFSVASVINTWMEAWWLKSVFFRSSLFYMKAWYFEVEFTESLMVLTVA